MKLTNLEAKNLLHCVSKDETKPYLNCIFFNATGKRLEATNGHVLTWTPFELDGDFHREITWLFKPDSSFRCKAGESIVLTGLDLEGTKQIIFVVFDRYHVKVKTLIYPILDLEFPQVNSIIEQGSESNFNVTLNLDLLPKGIYNFKFNSKNPITPVLAVQSATKQKFIIMPMRA